MHSGLSPKYPHLLQQGWVEFRPPQGEEGLYHITRNSGGTQVEVLRKHDGAYKAYEFPVQVAESASDEELAIILFENDEVTWQDYRGNL